MYFGTVELFHGTLIYDYWTEKKVIESKNELNKSLFGLSFNRVRQSNDFLAKYFQHGFFQLHLRSFVYNNINIVDACIFGRIWFEACIRLVLLNSILSDMYNNTTWKMQNIHRMNQPIKLNRKENQNNKWDTY